MRSQRKAGVVLSYLSEAVKILSSLIYTPVMLRLLGQSEYGLYQLVHSVIGYLGLLSFGFSSSYVRFYSRFKAEKDDTEIARLNGMFMTVFIVIAIITLICGFIMTDSIRSIFKEGLTDAEYDTAKILMVLMVINLAVTFPGSVFSCINSAHESFIFQRALNVASNILNPFLSLPLLLLGYGSIGLVVATSFVNFGSIVVRAWYAIHVNKARFIFHQFQFSLLKDIWGFTFFIFLNQIINKVNWTVDRFLLGRMINTTAVAIYGLGAQINTIYLAFSTSISSVFAPKINSIVAESDDNHALSLLFTRVGRIQFLVLSLIMSGFIFFGKPFMLFWGGSGYADSYYVALWLTIPVTVPLIQNLGIEIQRAKNKHQTRSIVYSAIAVANVCLSIPLIRKYGPIGASIGTAISLIVGNILFMNWYYQHHIGIEIKEFWISIMGILPALIVPVAVGLVIMLFINIRSLFSLLFWIGVYTIVYCISIWLLGMKKSEKDLVYGVLSRIRKTLKRDHI